MTKPKKKSAKWLIWSLIGILVILLVFAAINARKKPKGESVETEKVQRRDIHETVSASGKIFPQKEIKISSDVSGEIVELFVEEGDSVKAGQVLARIDPEAYISAVDRANASVNTSKSELARSMSAVENAVAQIEQIKAQVSNARRIHERNVKLLADKVISQQDFENSEANLLQLEANLRSAEASHRAAAQGVKSAEFNVASAEASLKEIRTNLSRTTISSPTDGIVSKLNVEQGERVVGTIQMAGTEMMRIANFNSMEVQVEVSENDILRVSLGDTADIEVDAYLNNTFKGIVTEIASSAANTASGVQQLTSDQVTNFIVKIHILPTSYVHLEDKVMPFRPGMSATVDIYTHTERNALSIPIQAVTTREKKMEGDSTSATGKKSAQAQIEEVVFVYEADTAKMVNVTTGIQDSEFIQVLSGLEEGQEVITGPYSTVSRKLKSGMTLQRKSTKSDKDNGKEK